MTRREWIAAPAALAAGASAVAAEAPRKSLFEMRIFRLRNGTLNQRQRTVGYLKSYVPLAKAAGAGPIGVFSSSIGEDNPYLVAITSFKSYADMDACRTKLRADPEYRKAHAEWESGGRSYEREEVRLLSAFGGFPAMTPPPTEGRKTARVFEMRTYELDTVAGLERKIQMFEVGETAIFVRAGMLPVFFAETVFGPNMPSLMYMLGFDDLAAREACGRASGADPAWKTLGAQYPDVATVPKLSIVFLNPLPFSDVR
jgi:hypothetical protein